MVNLMEICQDFRPTCLNFTRKHTYLERNLLLIYFAASPDYIPPCHRAISPLPCSKMQRIDRLLSIVAEKTLGDPERWRDIANNIQLPSGLP